MTSSRASMTGHNPTIKPPYEVKESGNGRGRGCFATRDIKPGEAILVSHTALHWRGDIVRRARFARMIDIYESSPETVQRDWLALLPQDDAKLARKYLLSLHSVGPDGSFFNLEKRQLYLKLMLNADNNSHVMPHNEVAVWPKVAMFNHSCDPNMTYYVTAERYRWVGRATRPIAKGEEIFLTYVPTNNLREKRREQLQDGWDFKCECPKCSEGEDRYTQSLIDARNAGLMYEPRKSEPAAVFCDNFDQFRYTIIRRIQLLEEIAGSLDDEAGKSRRIELTFALIDAYTFHRDHWHLLLEDAREAPDEEEERIREDMEEALIHVTNDRDYTAEALKWAKTAWEETDQMIFLLKKELERIEASLAELTQELEASSDDGDDNEGGDENRGGNAFPSSESDHIR